MNEKHYILPPIPKTPTNRDGSNNQTLTILTPAGSNPTKRNQSKIPIFYSSATTKTVQEYMILNKSISNHNSLNESTVYVEEPHQSSPQYTDKWKFQYVIYLTSSQKTFCFSKFRRNILRCLCAKLYSLNKENFKIIIIFL